MNNKIGFLKNIWWIPMFRGLALILFGILALTMPGLTFTLLVLFLTIYLVIDGIFGIIDGLLSRKGHGSALWQIIKGVIELIAGIYILKYPGLASVTVVIVIGIVLIVRSVVEIFSASSHLYDSDSKSLMILSGVLGIIAGILVLASPITSSIFLLWVLAIYALITGPILIALSFTLKSIIHDIERGR